jgi:hypothetical protein
MPDIFGSRFGKVFKVKGSTAGRFSPIDFNPKLAEDNIDILITSVGLSQSTKLALFHTLSDSIYIYPLGNEISKCIVEGLAVNSEDCNATKGQYTAAKKIIDFYEKHRASNFKNIANPVKLSIPPIDNLTGFIDGMTLHIGSSDREFGYAKFSITMSIIPNRNI